MFSASPTSSLVTSFRRLLLSSVVGMTLGHSATTVLAQDNTRGAQSAGNDTEVTSDDEATLPLPQHPGRKPETSEKSLPKSSQRDRDSRHTKYVAQRTTPSGMPVPGRPGRYLPPIGSGGDTGSDEPSDSALEAQESPGLLWFMPHEFRGGGINIECIYTGETFTKAKGGLSNRRATNYRSNLDLVAITDTEKMGWWDGGRIFVYGQNLSGRPTSVSDVGDIQLYSNLDSTINDTERPQFTTIAEYWYEHVALDNRLRTKFGKQDANVDFALTDLGGDFVHSSFGVSPHNPMPTFPSQALGAAGFYAITERMVLGMGFYDGTLPSGPQGVRWGFDTLGHNGAYSIYQVEYKPQLGPGGELPTTIRSGWWYSSNKDAWVEFSEAASPRNFGRNYGCFTNIDQMIWKESFGTDDTQGLGVFFQFGWAPSNRNLLTEHYGGGLVYKGLLPNRDNDLLGLGFANVLFSKQYREVSEAQSIIVGPSETAVELFYKAIVKNHVSLQPDIQYIAHPSGQYKDALVPGLRFEVVF